MVVYIRQSKLPSEVSINKYNAQVGAWYCTQKIGQNIQLFLFSILNFKVSKFYYF